MLRKKKKEPLKPTSERQTKEWRGQQFYNFL